MTQCALSGCPKEAFSRGWCQRHYTRWHRYGSADGVPAKRILPDGAPVRRISPRREIELVAIVHDRAGEQLRITATVSRRNEMVRETFDHDETPNGLADALTRVAEWIREGAP